MPYDLKHKLRLRRITTIAITFCITLGLFATSVLAEPGITVRYDPDKPNRQSAIFWLAYLMARMAYHEEHKLPTTPGREIVPSFEEELSGRRMAIGAYRDLKKKEHRPPDAYWETMTSVEAAGFLAPYVWTFHRRREWPTSKKPANMAAFESWGRKALAGHKQETYGSLEGNSG
jgi:hypothetical protein